MDPRINKLAKLLVNYSTDIQKGDKVLISYTGDTTKPLIRQVIKEVYAAGGKPYYDIKDPAITREIIMGCDEEQIEYMKSYELAQMEGMDAYIAVRASDNTAELSDVDPEKMNLYSKVLREVTDVRVNNTKWVVLRYPNNAMAQLSNTSLEAFEDFYFDVCTLDYAKMAEAMTPLVELINKTNNVRIVGKGTDLSFSIKDMTAVKCSGDRNIPDGEVYTAPVKDSVNGYITYNTPSEYQGFTYTDIKLTFKDGKIIDAIANNTERINKVFDTDEGARYVGEFAIGVNPYIVKPMNDILFDEKIMGSFHFTPGAAYAETDNGNKSSVHWDLVCIQTPEFGGGEIYFDDILIRKDGMFVIDELKVLNPENLK